MVGRDGWAEAHSSVVEQDADFAGEGLVALWASEPLAVGDLFGCSTAVGTGLFKLKFGGLTWCSFSGDCAVFDGLCGGIEH